MLTYTMDVEERSRWLRSTPSSFEESLPFWCSEVGAFYARKHFTTARSNKNSYIIFYTFGGQGVVRQGGQEITLGKGDALLMDCRSPQSYGTAPDHGHWYHLWTHIDGPGVAALGTQLGLPQLSPVNVLPSHVQPHFDVLFERLEHESIQNATLIGLAVHSLLAEMIAASLAGAAAATDTDPVRLVCQHIEAHFAEDLRLEDLADVAAVSPSYLIRLFKKQMGTTPHDYLLRFRVTRAKELLAETTLTSAAIARLVGFNSESNFSYRFSRMVGQSPRAYRLAAPELVLEQK